MRILFLVTLLYSQVLMAQTAKLPNILIIVGNDVSYLQLSSYNKGKLDFKTPNLDRLAAEGGRFTNYYAQQSSMAGHAAILTGQSPVRNGMLREGVSPAGLNAKSVTLAALLRERGYTTAQIGKSMLGEREDQRPTRHGFDSFYGTQPYSQIDVNRTLFDCKDTGKQMESCRYPGSLTTERMKDINQVLVAKSAAQMEQAVQDGKPFFIYHTLMRKSWPEQMNAHYQNILQRLSFFATNTLEFDDSVGLLTQKLESLGIADNTIVIVLTDVGAEVIPYGHAADGPNLGERNTYFEARFRVPAIVRWPGVVKPGSEFTGIASHEDWLPTLATPRSGVTLDGYDLKSYLAGQSANPRKTFFYWAQSGELGGVRYQDRKFEFMKQANTLNIHLPGAMVPLDSLLILNLSSLNELYQPNPEHEPGDVYTFLNVREHVVPTVRDAIVNMQKSLGKDLGSKLNYLDRSFKQEVSKQN